MDQPATAMPSSRGRFGRFGGQFVAPVLLPVLDRLEKAFVDAWSDASFHANLDYLLHRFVGRPTPLFESTRFITPDGGARLLLKRDDLTFSGGNYANAALGQCLLARRMGLNAVVTDTGSGQNGVATASVAAHLGLSCTVFMGAKDATQQTAAAKKIRAFGAELRIVDDGFGSLHAAISAAIRYWMGHFETTAYVAGAPIGPHPYPMMVGALHEVIGRETRLQMIDAARLPAAIVSSIGGGSSAFGLFSAFIEDPSIRLVAVEAAGADEVGADRSTRLSTGRRGILHGAETLVLADDDGNIVKTASIAPGLAYPGSAPQLAHLVATGRLEVVAIGDKAACDAVRRFARQEGVLVSLEAGHALAAAEAIARQLLPTDTITVMVPSSGDNDINVVWPANHPRPRRR
jgi:tryptophan synthase beta chain